MLSIQYYYDIYDPAIQEITHNIDKQYSMDNLLIRRDQSTEIPDTITEKVYYITSLSGTNNLSVSKSISKLIVRFHDKYYECILDSYIMHLRTRLDVIKQRVYIVSITEKSFYVHEYQIQTLQLQELKHIQDVNIEIVNFAFYPQLLLKSSSQSLVKQFGARDYYVYSLKNNNFETMQPSLDQSQLQPDTDFHQGIYYVDNSKFIKQAQSQNKLFFTTQTANHEIYIVNFKNNLFIFDLHTHQLIGKLKLQKPFISRLEYVQNIDKYFLFIVYDDLVLEIKQLIKITQGALTTMIEKNTQIIRLQQVNTRIKLKNIYFQKLLINSDSIYYALIVKIQIEEKSRLFIKNLLIFDENQIFHVYDQKQLLYLNVKSSLIQPSQYNNSILFMINNRAYLTHNMRVCDGIYECEYQYQIVCSTFQQTKSGEFLIMCAQQASNILIKKISIEKTDDLDNENLINGKLQLKGISFIKASIQDLSDVQLDQNKCQILCVGQTQTYYALLHNYMLKLNIEEQKYQICNIEQYYDNVFVKLVTYAGKFYLITIKHLALNLYKINDIELTLEASYELDQRPHNMQYQQVIGAIIIQYDNTNSSQLSVKSVASNNEGSRFLHRIIYIDNLYNEDIYADFQLNDFKNKLILNLDNRKFTTVEKSQYGLTYDNIVDIDSDSNVFIKSVMTYPALDDIKMFLQIQNNYIYQDEGTEIDQNVQFEQFNNMFKNALKMQNKCAELIAVFLSMNQLKIVDQITKFNKNEVSPWLYDYYATLDPVNKPTPRVSIEQIHDSYLLYLAPVYHLPDILFQAAQEDFKVKRDPLNVAFYFVITNKIPLLANLFKLTKQDKIYEFLKRDFSDPKNQQAAVKNAYTLVSKHNFLLAATWFIIGRQFKEGIQLLYQEKYLNDKFLAMRCIQLLYIQQNITKEQAHDMYSYMLDDLDISFEGLGNLQTLLKKSIVEQYIYNYQQKDYSKKLQNLLEIICFVKKRQLLNYTKDDLACLCTYLMCNHYYYQNMKISKIIIQFCRTFMLLINNNLLRIVYTRIVLDIGLRPLAIYSYKLDQKVQLKKQYNNANESDITISKIAEHYEKGMNNEITYQLGHSQRFDTLMQLLYSQSSYFNESYSNPIYVRIGMQQLYHANIYHMHRQLNVEFQDLIILYATVQSLIELLQADEQQFNIYSKIIDNYCQKYGIEDMPEKSAGTFQQAFRILARYGYSDYEKRFLNNILADVGQQDLNTAGVLIEQEMYYILKQNMHFAKIEDAKLYVDSLSVHQKNVIISTKHLQAAKINTSIQPVVYLIQTHPLIILLFDSQAQNLHLVRYDNGTKGLDFIQTIPATSFVLGKNAVIVLHNKQIHYYVYAFDNQLQENESNSHKRQEIETVNKLMNSQIVSCQYVKLDEAWTMQLVDDGFSFAVQKSLHKIIAINRETLILQFMDKIENQFDKDMRQRNIARAFKKKVIQDIVSVHIIDEYLVLVMFNSLERQYVFYLRISDILYEENLSTYQLLEVIGAKYDKMSCFSTGGKGHVVLSNATQFTTYVIQGPEYTSLELKELYTSKVGPKKTRVYLAVCEQDGDICCSNFVVRSIFKGDTPIDQCPICGKTISTDGQVNQLHDYRVVLEQ